MARRTRDSLIGGRYKYTEQSIPVIPQKKVPQWATYIVGRTPQFKMHTTVGLAKVALGMNGGICYRYMIEDGELQWVPVAIIDGGTMRSEHELFEDKFVPDQRAVSYVIQEMP